MQRDTKVLVGSEGLAAPLRAPDIVLLVSCGVLLLSGPVMSLQEFIRAEEEKGLAELTGTPAATAYDAPFRGWWRGVLFLVLLVIGVVGFLLSIRIARQPKVRSVSGRLLAILLVGITLFDLTFLADGRWFLTAPYEVRAATVVWLYPLAAILIGGATLRLVELERVFGEARR